jgi:hypothetical protein
VAVFVRWAVRRISMAIEAHAINRTITDHTVYGKCSRVDTGSNALIRAR